MSDRNKQRHELRAVPARPPAAPDDGQRKRSRLGLITPELLAELEAFAEALVEQIAEGVAERVLAEVRACAESSSPWFDVDGACAHLSFTRNTLYRLSAARAIPARKKVNGQGLRFRRDELDAWMEARYPRLDRLP